MRALDLGDFARGTGNALAGEYGGDLLFRKRVPLDCGRSADRADRICPPLEIVPVSAATLSTPCTFHSGV